jgi:transmembrane sensor
MKGLFYSLKSYMAGKLSYHEERKFLDWLRGEEGKDTYSKWVDSAYTETPLDDIQGAWRGDELLERTLLKKRRTTHPPSYFNKRIFSGWSYRIVAGLILLVFFGTIWNSQNLPSPKKEGDREIAPLLVTKQNPKGQKSRLILPDSSVVYLNADSKLTYKQHFAGGREVTLIGEAFFEVKSDSLNPFVVKSPRLCSTALGTSFTVSAYPDQATERVALARGKMLVSNTLATQTVLLTPGEGTVLKDNSEELTKVPVNTEIAALWTKGILYFDKVPWSQVIILLERWYGVTIHTTGSWSDPLCSGSFEENEYLNNVLKVLGHSVGFSHSINNKIVNIHLKP